jgi:hypothetical protein
MKCLLYYVTEQRSVSKSAIHNLGYMDSCQGLRELEWGEKLQLYFRKLVTEI